MKHKALLAATMMMAFVLSAGFASAKEVNFVGQFEHTLQWTDNVDLFDTEGDGVSEDDFSALQRIRMYFQYIDSETLRGVVGFELDTTWGLAGRGAHYGGGAVGTDGGIVETKHAYTDFSVGGVSFRVGLQGLAWPSAVAGSAILDEDVAGIVASYQFNDSFGLTAGWARLLDNQTADSVSSVGSMSDEVDAFTLIAPVTMDGWSMSPYIIYALHGANASGDASAAITSLKAANGTTLGDSMAAWWAGGAISLDMLDPFVFGADMVYGSANGSGNAANDMEGWFMAAMLTYRMETVTPSLAVLWGSGEDDDPSNGSEVMPNLASAGGGFSLTHFGFDGAEWTAAGGIFGSRTDYAGVALILDDFSFVERLSHTFTLVYGMGTSDGDLVKYSHTATDPLANAPVLTDQDTFLEVNFDSTYQIYENLSLAGKFGYLHVDLDEDVWAANLGANKDKVEDAMKFALILRYDF